MGNAHELRPFAIGVLDQSRHFVHVFDEFSLEVVMEELDTITDLCCTPMFVSRSCPPRKFVVRTAGEEQLVAAYILNGGGSKHPFIPDAANSNMPRLILFNESYYTSLIKHPEYQKKRRQDKISRAWDNLIERCIRLGDPKLVHPGLEQPNNETEKALRIMAAEPRFRRHLIIESMGEMLSAAIEQPGRRRARLFTTREQPDLAYILLVMPKLKTESFE